MTRSCLCGVVITDRMMQSVVVVSTGSWYDPVDPAVRDSMCKHGNPNVLSPDIGTSRLGQGRQRIAALPRLSSMTVRHDDAAFDPPEIPPG